MNSVADLVSRLKDGREEAWQEFMRGQGKLILVVGSRFGLDPADRDELFQISCIEVFRSIHGLRDPSKLGSWIYTIAYRNAAKIVKSKRKTLLADDIGDGSFLDGVPSDNPSPADIVEQFDESENVKLAMVKLSQPCRGLLEQLYMEDPRPSYEEISRRQKMPIGSIGPTKARCLQKLRRLVLDVSNKRISGTTSEEATKVPVKGRRAKEKR
jgi:RNA polymerase sigma factor (sigma-70 family)